jgi:hypothetical protein
MSFGLFMDFALKKEFLTVRTCGTWITVLFRVCQQEEYKLHLTVGVKQDQPFHRMESIRPAKYTPKLQLDLFFDVNDDTLTIKRQLTNNLLENMNVITFR